MMIQYDIILLNHLYDVKAKQAPELVRRKYMMYDVFNFIQAAA